MWGVYRNLSSNQASWQCLSGSSGQRPSTPSDHAKQNTKNEIQKTKYKQIKIQRRQLGARGSIPFRFHPWWFRIHCWWKHALNCICTIHFIALYPFHCIVIVCIAMEWIVQMEDEMNVQHSNKIWSEREIKCVSLHKLYYLCSENWNEKWFIAHPLIVFGEKWFIAHPPLWCHLRQVMMVPTTAHFPQHLPV